MPLYLCTYLRTEHFPSLLGILIRYPARCMHRHLLVAQRKAYSCQRLRDSQRTPNFMVDSVTMSCCAYPLSVAPRRFRVFDLTT